MKLGWNKLEHVNKFTSVHITINLTECLFTNFEQ